MLFSAYVTSGNYSTKTEERLDTEVEITRQVRDKLGSVAEQWRTSDTLLQVSSRAAKQAVEFWQIAIAAKTDNDRISSALDSRHSMQTSLQAFDGAQNALPQVDIPYVTPRQVSSVWNANIYCLTDLANESKSKHILEIYQSYSSNILKAIEWVQETYKRTLKKDLDDAEDAVLTVAKKLRHERLNNYSEIVGNRIYVPNSLVNNR